MDDDMRYWVMMIAAVSIIAVASLGLVSNIIGIFAIRSTERNHNLFNNILISLLVFDCLLLITAPLFFFGNNYDFFKCKFCMWAVPYWSFPGGHMAAFGSILMTLAIAKERYVATRHPFYKDGLTKQYQRKHLLLYIIPSAILVIAFNIPRFFVFHIQECISKNTNHTETNLLRNNSTNCTEIIKLTRLGNDDFFLFYYTYIANTVVFGLVPFSLLIYYNFRTYLNMKENNRTWKQSERYKLTKTWSINGVPYSELMKRKKKEEENFTNVMMVITVVFLGCHGMRLFLNFYDGATGSRGDRGVAQPQVGIIDPYTAAVHTSVFLVMINSSIGALIYCYISVLFRQQFVNVIKTYFNVCLIRMSLKQTNV